MDWYARLRDKQGLPVLPDPSERAREPHDIDPVSGLPYAKLRASSEINDPAFLDNNLRNLAFVVFNGQPLVNEAVTTADESTGLLRCVIKGPDGFLAVNPLTGETETEDYYGKVRIYWKDDMRNATADFLREVGIIRYDEIIRSKSEFVKELQQKVFKGKP